METGSVLDVQQRVGYKLMADWSISIFKEMLGTCGAYRTIEAVRPYSKHCGMAVSLNAINRFSLTPNTIESVLYPILLTSGLCCDGDCKDIEVHEQCGVAEIIECPYRAAPPEFCVATSHSMVKGICETVGPDFEVFYTQHLTEGKPSCRAVAVRKGRAQNFEELGPILRTLPKEDLTSEERRSLSINIKMTVLEIMTKAAEDLFGRDAALERLKPIMESNGAEAVRILVETGEEKEELTLIQSLSLLKTAMHQVGEIRSVNSEIRGETFSCPFNDNNASEACHIFEALCNGFCRSIDPNLEFNYSSMMTKGDKTCQWIVKKNMSPSEIQVLSVEEEIKKKALKALVIKYLDEELTKLEYDEARTLILD